MHFCNPIFVRKSFSYIVLPTVHCRAEVVCLKKIVFGVRAGNSSALRVALPLLQKEIPVNKYDPEPAKKNNTQD